MKKRLCLFFTMCILVFGCFIFQNTPDHSVLSDLEAFGNPVFISSLETEASELPDSIYESYYLSSEDPVFTYLQNNSIRRFFNMWFEYFIDEEGKGKVHWNYDTLAPVELLDHNFDSIARPDTKLYTCTFSTEDGRNGYIIVSYNKEGPSITKWSLVETTPYLYDLRANKEQILAALMETDIDLSTAKATRVEWIDTEKKRGDRIILFTDAKEDQYICYLGEEDYSIEKQ